MSDAAAPGRPPRIGISACFFHPDDQRPIFKGKTLLYLEQSMAFWVQSGGAIAYLITRSFERMLVVSMAIAVGSSVLGVYASFFIDSAPAPTIVLLMSLQFIAAFVWSQWQARRTTRYPTPT